MDVTASTQVAVASSSASTVNRAVYPSHVVPDPNNVTVHPVSVPNNLHNLPSASVIKSPNMTPFQPIRNINSAPESKNIHRNPSHNWRDNTRAGYPPRRRRNHGEQHQNLRPHVPHNSNAQRTPNPNAHKPQNAHNQNVPPPNALVNGEGTESQEVAEQSARLVVSGYPPYAQSHDIVEVFARFGSVSVDKFNSHSARLTFAAAGQARAALHAAPRLHVYGHFLHVRACAPGRGAPQSPRRDFTMSKQKSTIISPTLIDLSGDFDSQMEKILAAIRLKQEDIIKIQSLYKDLEDTFQKQWPGCSAVPFGSLTTGLGIGGSDADCFLRVPAALRQPAARHVTRARRLLQQRPRAFAEVLAIPRANTPIVKFYHVPTAVNCDLSFKTPLGTHNSRLVAFLLRADARVAPVALLLKYWAKVAGLSGTGRLSNYALTLMIVAYLQQPHVALLPSVAWLQRDPADELPVDGWNAGYMGDASRLPPVSGSATAAELLGGFFTFYGEFDFQRDVVCPFLGTVMRKTDFADTAALPDEFAVYKRNVLGDLTPPLRYQACFCVQDPIEQCHNVTSCVSSKLSSDIQAYFRHAAQAFARERETGACAGFLRKILLEQPKLSRSKPNVEYRVNLFPRIVSAIVSPEWKSIVRDLVHTIFEKMLKIKLERSEERVNPDAGARKEKEKYTGILTKPIWKRKKYKMFAVGPNLNLEQRQTLITEEVLKKEPEEKEKMDFQLMLIFSNDPKSAVIAVKMLSGHSDTFREFGKFFISVMQNWFTQLLKPFSVPNCKTTAGKIVESIQVTNNDNNLNSDDEMTPNTNESGLPAEEKTSANISEFFSSPNHELSQDDVDEISDACARI